jgi:hypothetical protein
MYCKLKAIFKSGSGRTWTPHSLAKIQDKTKIITLEQKKRKKKKVLKGIYSVLSQITLLCINNGFIWDLVYLKNNI